DPRLRRPSRWPRLRSDDGGDGRDVLSHRRRPQSAVRALAILIPAMACVVAALLLLARTPVDATYAVDLLPAMLLFGLGAGLGFPSLMTLAMSGATPSDSGLASGLVNTSVQVGGAIGLAVLATFATERTAARLADG